MKNCLHILIFLALFTASCAICAAVFALAFCDWFLGLWTRSKTPLQDAIIGPREPVSERL